MIVLALTGSIGMGKSTATRALRRLGVPVHDADAEVHRILREDPQAIAEIEAAFPEVVRGGEVDRMELGRRVFGDPAALRQLERILHPRVRIAAGMFLRRARAARQKLVVLDIPLLFETGGERGCDAVMVVSAPDFVRDGRVLARRSMTPERLAAILTRQTPDAIKLRRADFVLPTGLDRRMGLQALQRLVSLARCGDLRPMQAGQRRRHA